MKLIYKITVTSFILLFFSVVCIPAQEIFDAVRKGDLVRVKNLLEKNPGTINEKDSLDTGFLHYAVAGNYKEIAKELINKGADLNIQDRWGVTPLHYAAIRKNIEFIKLLLENGADISKGDMLGDAPIVYTFNQNDKESINLFIDKGFNLETRNKGGYTVLIKSVIKDKKDLVEILLTRGAKINLTDYSGKTALHHAVIRGYSGLTDFLLSKGADINAADKEGFTPYYYASRYGHKKLALLLASKGAKRANQTNEFDAISFLNKPVAEKEAYVWYLGHSGWAVKTKNNLLIFDFWQYVPKPEEPSLTNGNLNAGELAGQNVTFFASHEHGDHFDKSIMEFENRISKLKYVFGWKAKEEDRYYYFTKDREQKEIGNVKISSFTTPDPGSAFLVETDGLKLVFFGDFYTDNYKDNFDYIAQNNKNLDMYFILANGGPMDITHYALEKLTANSVFLMHAGNAEFMLDLFVKENSNKFNKINFAVPHIKGDLFHYKNGKMKEIK